LKVSTGYETEKYLSVTFVYTVYSIVVISVFTFHESIYIGAKYKRLSNVKQTIKSRGISSII